MYLRQLDEQLNLVSRRTLLQLEIEGYQNRSPITGDESYLLRQSMPDSKLFCGFSLPELWKFVSSSVFAIGHCLEPTGTFLDRAHLQCSRRTLEILQQASKLDGTTLILQTEEKVHFSHKVKDRTYEGELVVIPRCLELVVEGESVQAEWSNLLRFLSENKIEYRVTVENERLVTDFSAIRMVTGTRYDSIRSPIPPWRGYYGHDGLYLTTSAVEKCCYYPEPSLCQDIISMNGFQGVGALVDLQIELLQPYVLLGCLVEQGVGINIFDVLIEILSPLQSWKYEGSTDWTEYKLES